MDKFIYTVFGMLLFTVCMVGFMVVIDNKQEDREVERSVSLSSKVLLNSLEREGQVYDDMSEGYIQGNSEILKVNKEYLMEDFMRTLENNFMSNVYYDNDLGAKLDNGVDERFMELKKSIPMMLLTRTDHFYYATPKVEEGTGEINNPEDIQYKWSEPIVYSIRGGEATGESCSGEYQYELDLESNQVEKYRLSGSYEGTVELGEVCYEGRPMDEVDRDRAVVDLVNGYVNARTSRNDLPFYMKADLKERGIDPEIKSQRGLQLDIAPKGYDIRVSSESGEQRTKPFYSDRSTIEVGVKYRNVTSPQMGIQLVEEGTGSVVDTVVNPHVNNDGADGRTYQVRLSGLEDDKRYYVRVYGDSGLDWDIEIKRNVLGDRDKSISSFNMLEGITFMILYNDADIVPMVRENIIDYNYNVTGYTVRW